MQRRLAVGLCVTVLVLGLNGVWVYWTEKDAPSFPQSRQEMYTGNGYSVMTSDEVDPEQEGGTWVFEKGADLEAAKRLLPELQVPAYLPDGYEIEELTVSSYMSGHWEYSYLYNNGIDNLEINQEWGGEIVVAWSGSEVEKEAILAGME